MTEKKVIVIGAGIVGMMTAVRLKASGFDVCLMEKGVAATENVGLTEQSNHLHVLLQAGMESCLSALPELIPFFRTLPEIDWSEDTLWENRFGAFPRRPTEVRTRGISRKKLESSFREALSFRDIDIQWETAIQILKNEQNEITGVQTASGQIYPANAVVISSGAGASVLLSGIQKQTFPLGLTYRSVVLKNLPTLPFRQYYYQLDPSTERFGGVITPIENNTWIATLMSYEEEQPIPLTFDDFKELCRQVPGQFSKIVSTAEPASSVFGLRRDKTHLLKKGALRHLPTGAYVIGDALASLNPAFGQGMTVGLLQIDTLVETLLHSGNSRRRRQEDYHLRALGLAADALHLSQLASGQKGKLATKAFQYLLKRTLREPELHLQFIKVLHFKAPIGKVMTTAFLNPFRSFNRPNESADYA
ncbi:MAG: FAD-dependent oxidoreductase [Bdellovibrionales bacterium]|nr:FAD-dependent oxidoreductase [Bdellovibrionales bacterium]